MPISCYISGEFIFHSTYAGRYGQAYAVGEVTLSLFFSLESLILSGKHIVLGKSLNSLTPQVFSENKRIGSFI